MKAITLENPKEFQLHDFPPADSPRKGQALVRVRSVGICGTDLHAYRGRQPFFTYPRILGHELSIEVVDLGENVDNVVVGDRCAVNPYLHCGKCSTCKAGKTNCCESLKVLGVHVDGGMREEFTIPAAHLYSANDLTDSQRALVETLGIGAHAVNRSSVAFGESTLVIGAGPIGLAVMEFLRLEGAATRLLEVAASRRDFANTNYQIERLYGSLDAVIADGPLPTLVLDCTGNSQSMHDAFRLVAHGGRLVFVGLFVGDVTFHDPDFHRREMTLLATRNCTVPEHARILTLLRSGKINTTPWVSVQIKADQMIEKFPALLDPDAGIVKAIVDWT